MPAKPPDREQILEMASDFMPGCVIGAAAELDLFTALGEDSLTSDALADRLAADRRATRILLDAAVAIGLLNKQADRYSLPAELRPLLLPDSPDSLLPMLHHRMNVLRSWSQLALVTMTGAPAPSQASIRGAEADRAAFVAAMHGHSRLLADELIARLKPPQFLHLLDVGGASGTWTLAFLRAVRGAKATIFDLPDAIQQARERIDQSDLADRVTLVAGDFYVDPLPPGADFAWLSAIVHQHSRQHNRNLFGKVHSALVPGGRIAIRDVVMEPSRTRPVAGALFAINMLVNTDSGGTFTLDELAEDLQAAGFVEPQLAVRGEMMDSIVVAHRA